MGRPVILFASLPSRAVSVTMPMSYIYLSAWLDRDGIPSGIVDIKRIKRPGGNTLFDTEEALRRILKEIEVNRPKYVGFTCYTSDFSSVMKVGRLVKER